MVENYIKRYFKHLDFAPQNIGQVYAPIRHIGGVEKNLLKMAFYPQMRKIDGCAWWVHILGVRRGENKVLYHTFIPYKYCWITPSQTKVMKL